MPSRISSIFRYLCRANRIFSQCLLIMRPYQSYVSRSLLCVISDLSKYYEQYFRSKRTCELVLPDVEIERLFYQKKELFDKAIKAKVKTTRFVK
jgi:hypothetical protein